VLLETGAQRDHRSARVRSRKQTLASVSAATRRATVTRQQAVSQQARRTALDAASAARIKQAAKDQRVSRLATKLGVTLARREEAIERWDRRVGELLFALTREEHLTLDEAIAWAGVRLTRRQAFRMRAAAESAHGGAARTEPA
jgi:hypothetical protein